MLTVHMYPYVRRWYVPLVAGTEALGPWLGRIQSFAKKLIFAGVLTTATLGHAQEEFTFDVSEFEKKPFELRGYVEFEPEYQRTDKDAALYQLTFFGEDERDSIDRYTGTLELEGRYDGKLATLSFRTHSEIVYDYEGEDQDHALFEGLLSTQPRRDLTVELGKKAIRWGKGVAWNPVAFVERAKDAGDPDISREGFWILGLDWIRSFDGPLQAIALTPLVLPTYGEINDDFGDSGSLNPAMKLYLLYKDTDIDLMFLGEGSQTARWGFDFAKNLAPNFEIHGEYAYITDVERRLIRPNCSAGRGDSQDLQSYLLGLRYRTARDVNYTFEYYFNGFGNSEAQQALFYECVHIAWETDDEELFNNLPRGKDLDRGPFSKPNAMRQYLHFKAIWDEPYNILYFAPGVQMFYNLDDDSYSVAPEVTYTGIDDLELRLRATVPVGPTLTEWGEKPNEFKVELRARYYF